MRIAELKILVASALLSVAASAQALQPEVLYAFQVGPRNPSGRLIEGTDGNFYGTTAGWINWRFPNPGTVFRVTTNGVLTTLASTGPSPSGLALDNDGNFYGTTRYGGSGDGDGPGTVFKVTIDGVFTTLNSTNGANLQGDLVLGRDGNFYGTTYGGGSSGLGTVFQLTTNGVLTSLVSFDGTNGANPRAGPVLGHDGNFYGTTANGGSGYVEGSKPGYGTVFKVTTNGVLVTLAAFNGANGTYPLAGLVLGEDGNFYGTTYAGGSGGCRDGGQGPGCGTVFKVTTNGVVTTLVSFTGENGRNPQAGLVLGRDGCFYGTTTTTLFKVTTNGVLITLFSFSSGADNGSGASTNANGGSPQAGLALGSDGAFYGTTFYGGSQGYGTVFKVTTSGALTTLIAFAGSEGAHPQGGLVLGTDGDFYGTTWLGGTNGARIGLGGFDDAGTVFKVTTNGVLTSLVSFNDDNGANPYGGLVLGRDGIFYGTTAYRGPGGGGTIFRLVISAFTSVARQPGGRLLLTGTGPANGNYRLWATTDLSLPVAVWTLVTGASFDSNGNFSYTDVGAITNPSRFYQISVP